MTETIPKTIISPVTTLEALAARMDRVMTC
jgi:hypothetical protein